MDQLAQVCERVASYRSRLRKVELVADYLHSLSDGDMVRAVNYLCCGPAIKMPGPADLFGNAEERKLSIGYATLREATIAATGWDGAVLARCHEEVGDTGETISLLLPGHTREEPLSLARAEEIYTALYRCRRTAEKISLLSETFKRYRPLAIKYFVKVITGNLRIGLQARMVEEAISAATGAPHEAVRLANNRLGDMATVALAARHGRLEAIKARLFHPMDYMLAKPVDWPAELPDPVQYSVEDKYDGIRSQVHSAAGRVAVYTRGMQEVSAVFPELTAAFARLPGELILDGEILAYRDERPMSFAVLQQRLARNKVSQDLLSGIPVVFIAYDILFDAGELLLDKPIEERRAALEAALEGQGPPIILSPRYSAESVDDVSRLFEEARARGNEGLLMKRHGSRYEAGRRSGAWYKIKREYGTLDVVITSAEQGSGKRATVLSDYTFAVRSGERFLNVGKAYSGLTDKEVRELTRVLRSAALEKYGRALLVRPEVVLEVAFDGVSKSPRHKSGYALRFPRIVRWRRDKKAEDADDLQRVQTLYEESLAFKT